MKVSELNEEEFSLINEEKLIIRKLFCRYFVKIYDIFFHDKKRYCIMEYLPGQSLLHSKPELNFESIWKYIRNLVSAIEYCKFINFYLIFLFQGHEIAQIVHNKIDYDSLFIDENNLLRLSNFGSTKFIDKNKFLKYDTINNKSKPIPTPPEIKKDNFYEGKAFDIWLLGSCLFQMIFKRSFDGQNWYK